jgi:hypothetical protein
VHLELWHVITIFITLITAFAALIKFLFSQFDKGLDKRFENMGKRLDGMEADSKDWLRIEREFLQFKAELPVHYVRREDYVRGQTVLEAKLDAVFTKIENIQLKGAAPNEH